MQDKKVYVAAAAFLTITTMVGTVMAGCGSGGSHVVGDSVSTRQLTWGGDINSPTPSASNSPGASPTPTASTSPAPSPTGSATTSPAPSPSPSASATPNSQLTWGGD